MPKGQAPWVGGPTPLIRKAISLAITRKRMPLSHAAALCGVHQRTARRWLEQGDKDIEAGEPRTKHALFARAVARARAQRASKLINVVEREAKRKSRVTGLSDPKVLLRLLELTDKEFRPKNETEVTGRVEIADPRERLESLLGGVASRSGTPRVDPEPEPEGR